MFFAPFTFPDTPVLDRHEDATRFVRADQAPLNFSSDTSDISDLLSALSCFDGDLTDVPDSDVSDVRTIDGSSRLYSKTNARYLLPLDQEEFQRLDKQDTLLRLGMWGLLPLRDSIEEVIGKVGSAEGNKTVLDVGCGSGQWAIAMASVYTHIQVVAIDQASQLPEERPGNVDWRRHDVNLGLKEYHEQYDIVHVRCIGAGITSYRGLLEEASKCLKPGGLAIFIEGDFDLFDEDQRKVLEPAGESNPDGCHLQKWMQAVRKAQIRRCGLLGSDDSPETLDEGLWQFNVYDPSSCHTASIFTPVTPWPKSEMVEETLHFRILGTLMRQNLKSFMSGTEQLLIEEGHTKEEVTDWMSRILGEMEGVGRFKWWLRWRAAWGRAPSLSPSFSFHERIASHVVHPQKLPSERWQEATEHLMSQVHKFTLQQCHIRNRSESMAYAKRRNHEPFSTRGQF